LLLGVEYPTPRGASGGPSDRQAETDSGAPVNQELDHPDVPFGLVVVKGHSEVGGEPQHVGPLSVETTEQVERLLVVARPLATFRFRVEVKPLVTSCP
jgi:hypothetical protein